jgi:hypothetical protein
MVDTSHFWWQWSVEFAVALATFAAVAVALFGDWIRARFLSSISKPDITFTVADPLGQNIRARWLTVDSAGKEETRDASARYYHLRISNKNV